MIIYQVTSNLTGVTVTCIFMSVVTTNSCIVVVHQRVSRPLSSDMLLLIKTFTLTRHNNTAFLMGLSLKDYQVGVIGGKRQTSETEVNKSGTRKHMHIV